MNHDKIIEYFDKIAPERAKWIKRSKFYYNYLNNFIDFLLPKNKEVFRIEVGDSKFWKIKDNTKKYDYVVITDVLGYVEDIQIFFNDISKILKPNGRIVITQYNALWEPILRIASKIGLRMPSIEQNWLSMNDLKNLAYLADFEIVKSGTKMLMPKYIPLISAFLNKILANIYPFTKFGLFHYIVVRKSNVILADNPSISIIVPARNEAGTIEKIAKDLPALGNFTEIIFIEGNSTDNTYDEIVRVVKKYSENSTKDNHTKKIFKYGKQDGKGKGDAVRKGFEMATGDILTIFDADMTVPANEMKKFYEAISSNKADFINGSRLVYPLEKDSMRVLNFFANKFFSFAFSAILGQQLKDTLCGTKVIWNKDYQDLKNNRKFFGDFDPFGDFDLLFGAAKLNLKIIDLPIHYKERVYGETNIRRWSHGWLLLKMTIFVAKKMKMI